MSRDLIDFFCNLNSAYIHYNIHQIIAIEAVCNFCAISINNLCIVGLSIIFIIRSNLKLGNIRVTGDSGSRSTKHSITSNFAPIRLIRFIRANFVCSAIIGHHKHRLVAFNLKQCTSFTYFAINSSFSVHINGLASPILIK